MVDVEDCTKKLEVLKKTNSAVVKPSLSSLQNSQTQTTALVSASDELVKTFSKMSDRKFFKATRDPEGIFSWKGYDIIPLRGNKIRIEGKTHD